LKPTTSINKLVNQTKRIKSANKSTGGSRQTALGLGQNEKSGVGMYVSNTRDIDKLKNNRKARKLKSKRPASRAN